MKTLQMVMVVVLCALGVSSRAFAREVQFGSSYAGATRFVLDWGTGDQYYAVTPGTVCRAVVPDTNVNVTLKSIQFLDTAGIITTVVGQERGLFFGAYDSTANAAYVCQVTAYTVGATVRSSTQVSWGVNCNPINSDDVAGFPAMHMLLGLVGCGGIVGAFRMGVRDGASL